MKNNLWSNRWGMLVSLLVVVIALCWHLSIGTKIFTLPGVAQALFFYDDNNFSHLIIRELRLPRALVAATVGACLSVAGALLQGITRNPLADPSLLGMMSGGALAVVAWMGFVGEPALAVIPLVAAIGALLSALIVWSIASRAPGGLSPLSLILAGAAFSAFVMALLSIHHLLDESTFEQMRQWLVGSLQGSNLTNLMWCLPWAISALIGAVLLAPSLTALSMGETVATGLGIDIKRRKGQVLLCAVILTAVAVALAGPLGFIGLVIPHVVRLLVGADYRWIIPYSILLGAGYLLFIDTLARWIIQPQEIATGLISVLFGAPLFIWLVKNRVA
jgi:iron complex transport system permease protein